MKPQKIREMLAQTLEDRRLPRGEKSAVGQILEHLEPRESELSHYRSMAFDLAREAVIDFECKQVIGWLEDVVKLLRKAAPGGAGDVAAEARFSPQHDCPGRIRGFLRGVKKSVDICVFTITDDRLSSAILDAHRRGVTVRIISDDDKATDPGSDMDRMERAGIPVRVDRSPFHMHHKFALFDGTRLLTGSYNWTRSAAERNEENFIVTGDSRLIGPFSELFDSMWDRFGD